MALVVALDVVLSLGIFGVLEYQQSQISSNSAKNDCWSAVLDNIVKHKPPAITHLVIDQADACQMLP